MQTNFLFHIHKFRDLIFHLDKHKCTFFRYCVKLTFFFHRLTVYVLSRRNIIVLFLKQGYSCCSLWVCFNFNMKRFSDPTPSTSPSSYFFRNSWLKVFLCSYPFFLSTVEGPKDDSRLLLAGRHLFFEIPLFHDRRLETHRHTWLPCLTSDLFGVSVPISCIGLVKWKGWGSKLYLYRHLLPTDSSLFGILEYERH